VRVDRAGQNRLATKVDDSGIWWRARIRPPAQDLSILDDDCLVSERFASTHVE